jgi:hypothetical protein
MGASGKVDLNGCFPMFVFTISLYIVVCVHFFSKGTQAQTEDGLGRHFITEAMPSALLVLVVFSDRLSLSVIFLPVPPV